MDYSNNGMRTGARKQIVVAVIYFFILAVSTLVIIQMRSDSPHTITSEEGDECICEICPNITMTAPTPPPVLPPNCTKKDEEITHLNKTATDFRDQIGFMRQQHYAARRKRIEEREGLRMDAGYYKQTRKVAICFSGFLRNSNLTEERIRNELFGLFGEDNIDIFMFVPEVVQNGTIEPLPQISWNVTEIRTYKQQDLREPKAGYQYHYRTNFQGWLQQYYGISGCYNVIRDYQERTKTKYEWIARARPDVVYFYPNTTVFEEIFTLQNLDSNVWWIPDNQHWDGANDKFMLSSSMNYELYADFENVYYYTGLFKPEIYHKATVEQYGIKIKSIKNFTTKIVREDGKYGPW